MKEKEKGKRVREKGKRKKPECFFDIPKNTPAILAFPAGCLLYLGCLPM